MTIRLTIKASAITIDALNIRDYKNAFILTIAY
jgi:hypothetical protein